MSRSLITVILIFLVVAFTLAVLVVRSDPPSVALTAVERGRYLVHNVGLCIDCHSPRNELGEFLADRHLTGSPLFFAPTVPMPWAEAAPPLAGLTAYSAAHVRSILTTGARPDGSRPRPPMPPFAMTAADANAVVVYLQSLR